jgi:hypothetical protein
MQTRKERKSKKSRKERKSKKSRKERKSKKSRKERKSRKAGGLFDKLKKWNAGCPTGKVRMHGAQCGIFRGPFGCCRK